MQSIRLASRQAMLLLRGIGLQEADCFSNPVEIASKVFIPSRAMMWMSPDGLLNGQSHSAHHSIGTYMLVTAMQFIRTQGNWYRFMHIQERKWFAITVAQRPLSRGVVPTASFFSKMFTTPWFGISKNGNA